MLQLTASLRPKNINTAKFTTTVTHMEKKSPFLVLNTFRTEYKSCFSTLCSNLLRKSPHCTEIPKQEEFPATSNISNTNIVTGICQRDEGKYSHITQS